MYGMVNHGIQSFITENFGAQDWIEICKSAGLSDTEFEHMITYPDEITYNLVGAICEKYKLSGDAALETFGAYWVGYSSKSKIGQLIRFGGSELIERLENLDSMHARIKLSMPHLRPPQFEFDEEPGDTHKLHYSSHRDGMEAMVIGLVKGLAEETGDKIEITQQDQPDHHGFKATFVIRIL